MNHRTRNLGILVLFIALLAAPAVTSINAQQDTTTPSCPAITTQALETTRELCTEAINNEACYGHIMLDARPQPNVSNFKFDTEGDITRVADMATLRLSAMDPESSLWGVALMRLQLNQFDSVIREPAMLLLFGDVSIASQADEPPSVTFPVTVNTDGRVARLRSTPEGIYLAALDDGTEVTATGRDESAQWIRIELETGRSAWIANILLQADQAFDTLDVVNSRSALYAPMQAFYMTSAANDSACPEAPNSGLIIQTPEGVAELTFLINEVDIQLGSTVVFQAQAGEAMTVSVLEGHATVSANGVTTLATAGAQITVPLNTNGQAAGAPSLPSPYKWEDMQAMPTTYLDDPVAVAPPISETELAQLLANQPGLEEEPKEGKVYVCHEGNTLEISESALQAHLDHGDIEGVCETVGGSGGDPIPPPEDKVQVCHNGATISISASALPAHLAHGDTEGTCP